MKEPMQPVLSKRPLIISGPCSAETRDQLVQTAIRLKNTGKIHLLRAGIWKPRTKPGMFEGIGAPALEWLAEARQATGLPTTVEVAKASHVDLALRSGVDVLWLGARTTVNPFSVQELADSLKGVDVPVLIKNPINPDLELWCGAIERILHTGVREVGMIHRGFSSYGNTEYRNAPMWQLPIEMKRRYPGMMLLCDPSHICGNRFMLQGVAQKSIDLDFDGLMIESHIDPDHAWSDAKQQVTPERLSELLDALVWRTDPDLSPEIVNKLALLRSEIDQVDDELLELFSRRMKIAEQIGEYKKENNMTILQAKRWNDILQRAVAKSLQLGLSREFIVRYLDAVHMESIQHQTQVMNNAEKEIGK